MEICILYHSVSVLLQESSSGGCTKTQDWMWEKSIDYCWAAPGRGHYWRVPSKLCRCCKFLYCFVSLGDTFKKRFWNNLLQFEIAKPLIPSCTSSCNSFHNFKGSAVKTCPSFAGLCTLMNPRSFLTAFVYTSVVLDW